MHPADCPGWEYDGHPDKSAVLLPAIKSALTDLRTKNIDSLDSIVDTRPVHYRLFNQLTPPECNYYAGNYRGSNFRCLKYYPVRVPGDTRVGFASHVVHGYMNELSEIIKSTVAAIDAGMSLPNGQVSLRDKIGYLVAATCYIFELFLRIHPYANGNGHTGRFCVWTLLGRYNFWVTDWPIEPRPADPPYTDLIKKHRDGDKEPLEYFIMSLLVKN